MLTDSQRAYFTRTNPPRACFNQPCEIAILENFTPDCNYCSIGFVDKPCSIRTEISTESMVVDIFFEDVIPKELFTEKPLHFAIITPIANDSFNIEILEVSSTEVSRTSRGREINHYCRTIDANVHVVELIKSAYRRRHRNIGKPIISTEQLEKAYFEFEETKKAFKNALSDEEFLEVNDAFRNVLLEGDNSMNTTTPSSVLKLVPSITRCIINDPAVIIFWSDGTKTIGKCMDNDEFNPEVGLAMAISRKFYKIRGFSNPRAAFKNQLKNAEDRSAKTKEKRERKKNKLEAANEVEEA